MQPLPLPTVIRWLELGRPVAIEECPVWWQDKRLIDVTDPTFVRLRTGVSSGRLRDTRPRRPERQDNHPVSDTAPPWRPLANLLRKNP